MPIGTDGVPTDEERVPMHVKRLAEAAHRYCKQIMIDCATEKPQPIPIGDVLANRKLSIGAGVSSPLAAHVHGHSPKISSPLASPGKKPLGDHLSTAFYAG